MSRALVAAILFAGCAPLHAADAPSRLADGSVFLPKPAQRQIGLRTMEGRTAALARAVELNGRVVMDPNAGGKVQALIAGRIEPGPKGLPGIGQRVQKGEVLAQVVPAIGQVERSNQAATLAELRAAHGLGQKRLARLRELADTVPRKEIEAAESELLSLAGRIAAVSAGLDGRDRLVAPVSGVIASSSAVAGQVVDARELIYEIVDPGRLRIEALAYDLDLARDIAGASLAIGGKLVRLEFLGAGRALREQALPLAFRASGEALAQLAVGQPVKIVVRVKAGVQGIAVPAAAVVRDASNRGVLWVKTAPERFAPRPVTVEPLDGISVAVTAGLKAGERVVVSGAALVNQVR